MGRNQKWYFLGRKVDKIQVCIILHIFIDRKLKHTLAPCWPHVARVWFCFLSICWGLNQPEACKVGKLVWHHINISNILIEQLKVGALFKALFQTKVSNLSHKQLLHSRIVKNYKNKINAKQNMLVNKKFVCCFTPHQLVLCYTGLKTKHNLLKDPNSTAIAYSQSLQLSRGGLLFTTPSKHHYSQTERARELKFWENVHPHLPPPMYHM